MGWLMELRRVVNSDGASYHMASFDYAYNCVAVMEWLFQQSK